MGGKETLAKLLEIDPDVKTIVASGYSKDPVMASYKEFGFSAVMNKPYTMEQIKKAINEALTS